MKTGQAGVQPPLPEPISGENCGGKCWGFLGHLKPWLAEPSHTSLVKTGRCPAHCPRVQAPNPECTVAQWPWWHHNPTGSLIFKRATCCGRCPDAPRAVATLCVIVTPPHTLAGTCCPPPLGARPSCSSGSSEEGRKGRPRSPTAVPSA